MSKKPLFPALLAAALFIRPRKPATLPTPAAA